MKNPIFDICKKAEGFGKTAFILRVFAYLFTAILIVVYCLENHITPDLITYLTFGHLLITPHLLLAYYVWMTNDKGVALRQNMVDLFTAGMVIGNINLEPVASYLYLLGAVIVYIADRGPRKIYRLLLIPIGCLFTLSFYDFELHQSKGHLTTLITFGYGGLHLMLFAYISNQNVKHYVLGKRKAWRQKEEINVQKTEIYTQTEELKTINESLKQTNDILESKVAKRIEQLKFKNNILSKHANTNTNKLEKPTKSILNLIGQLSTHLSHEEKMTLIALIKTEVISLDDLIEDIGINLDHEDYLLETC